MVKKKKIFAIMPDGKTGAPCGPCREVMAQLMHGYRTTSTSEKGVTPGKVTPKMMGIGRRTHKPNKA